MRGDVASLFSVAASLGSCRNLLFLRGGRGPVAGVREPKNSHSRGDVTSPVSMGPISSTSAIGRLAGARAGFPPFVAWCNA